MKIKFILSAAFLLLANHAFAGKWMIDSFDNSPDPGEADSYIAGEVSGGLKPVQPGQVSAKSGTLYVRQKFEDPFGEESSYQIFQGRATDAAQGLGKISLDAPIGTLLKLKYFYTKSTSGEDDLETVYFDGKDILVEGEDPVYVNLNGKWEELKPVAAKEYKVSITSTPSGATVFVSNSEKGKTPATFTVPSSKPVTVVVSMDGYYSAIKSVTPSEKQTVQEGVNLVTKPPLENPADAYRTKFNAANASRDASALKNLKADIQKTLNNYTAETKKNVDAVMSKFPANPPKTASESANDFSGRQSVWTNTQSKERDALNKQAQEYFTELKALLTEVDAAASGATVAAPPVVAQRDEDDEEESASYDEDEDEEEFEEGMDEQEEIDYSRYGAAGSATAVFGNTDEYLFWSGMAFAAAAIGTGVVGFLQQQKWNELNDAYKDADKWVGGEEQKIRDACASTAKPDDCTAQTIKWIKEGRNGESEALYIANKNRKDNETIRDTYHFIPFYLAAGVSAVISITLFTW